MSVEQQILLILQKSQETRLHDLVELTGASRQMVHRAVKSLAQRGLMEKLGSRAKTYYRLIETKPIKSGRISQQSADFLIAPHEFAKQCHPAPFVLPTPNGRLPNEPTNAPVHPQPASVYSNFAQ